MTNDPDIDPRVEVSMEYFHQLLREFEEERAEEEARNNGYPPDKEWPPVNTGGDSFDIPF